MAHANEMILGKIYEAFSKGDMADGMAAFTDDIAWHASGRNPVSGNFTGKTEVLGFFKKMMDVYDGPLQVEILDILANDRNGIVLTIERGMIRGETLEFRAVHHWKFRDGKCARFENYADDAYHEFWSRHSSKT
ncbi:MAG: nuclear transport factor 2 family protein [Acidobacteriaceae bacterium]